MTAYTDAHEEAALAYLLRRAAGTDWEADALCKELGQRLFYPEMVGHSLESPSPAVRACGMCPVMAECRARALATREPVGVWGGMTEVARKTVLVSPEATRQALLDALNGVPPTLRIKKSTAGQAADDAESTPDPELKAA